MIGGDVNARDEEGWTVMTLAAADGRVDLVELLLGEAEVDVNYPNQFGETALIRAVFGGHLGLAKLLLDRGADINLADEDGETPLHVAVICGNVEMTWMLLERKADVELRNKKGRTALDTADRYRQTEIVDALENYRSNGLSGKMWRTVQGVGGWVSYLIGRAVVGEPEGEAALGGGEVEKKTMKVDSSELKESGSGRVEGQEKVVEHAVTEKLLSRGPEAEQSVATLLPELLELCSGMEETLDICEDMLERLRRVEMLLDEKEEEVPTRVRASFQLITTRFHAFLVQHSKQTSVERLASTRTILRLLHDFHCDIDEVIARVAPAESVSSLTNWKENWDEACLAVENRLITSWEQNSSELSRELPDTTSQTSALLLLNSETIRHRPRYSARSQELLESASKKIARMSGAPVPKIPQWFVPRHEVQWQATPFACGSYGEVYRGIWRRSKVVIKCMTVSSPSEEEAFLREATIWHRARHPHIVNFFGACYNCHPCFFICEEAANGNLVDYLDKRKEEGRSLIWSKLHEAALGLEYLHQNRILHGDLKCNQILVTGEGVAKLTDFGFSFVLSESTPQGAGGATRWRAPECLGYKGRMPSFESDIYSFGMCIVEAMTSDVPWGVYLPDAAVMDHLRHRQFIPRPKEFTVDAEWEFVLALCAFEPSKRIKLVDAIRQLERFAGDATVSCGFSLSNRLVQLPPVREVALPEDVPRFEFDTVAVGSGGLPYNSVCIDHPTPGRSHNLETSILHVLMHRLDVQSSLYSRNEHESELRATRSGRAARFSRQAVAGVALTQQSRGESVFNAAVRLLLSLDAPARSEVLRLLLERRFVVPFIVPTSSAQENALFYCDLTSLGLITTAIDRNGNDIVSANLATDSAHMRVAVLSDNAKGESASTAWIESVFHVQSFHALDRKNQVELTKAETAAEIGWGFLKDDNGAFVPVVLLHVVGDYRPLRDFITTFADAVVLDAGSSSCDIKLQRGALLKWRLDDPDPDQESSIESSESDPVFVESLRCSDTTSVTMITKSLLEEFGEESRGQWERIPLDRMQSNEVQMVQAPRFDFDAIETKISFADLRSQLQLQLLFAQESREVIAFQRESDPMKLVTQKTTIATFQRLRQELAPSIDRHDAIVLFKDILRTESASTRIITLLDLERWLTTQCEEQAASARKAYREARKARAGCEILAEKLNDWDMKTTRMEHLWRELSHLYVVDPVIRSNLAKFAAQHLLDGFSLELMDGDAGMMNLKWIQGVLKELLQELRAARLLVLSVMGVQSSGKSTLLNYMFGVRFRESARRCTRGVSIQLLRSEGHDEYEYVLLLDTEGIRAPENIGTEDSVWRDNRMAAFTVLSADATIILTKGESTTTINEILPVVLSAYLESETAQNNGGQLPSKLLFVFNQIDLAEKSKLENVVDTLKRQLKENARKVENIRRGHHLEESGIHSTETKVFDDLNMNVADEEGSDVRVLGTIKAESYPPRDAPLPDYGRRLLNLREHIHRRVCTGRPNQSWNGRTVEDFSEYITMVWKCIESSNFHFNFIAAFERINYDLVVHKIDQCAQELTDLYCTAFEAISNDIRTEAERSSSNDPLNAPELSDRFGDRLTEEMMFHLLKLDAEVSVILEDERFSKWSTDQLSRWMYYKEDQAAHWRRLMDGLVNNIFLYESIVEGYKKELRERANLMFSNGGFQNFSSHEKQRRFDNLFDELVHKANAKYPPFHIKVGGLVDQVFARNKDLVSMMNPTAKSTWGKVSKMMYWQDSSKLYELQRSIERDVKQTLKGVTQYSDGIVVKCIQLTKFALVDAESRMRVSGELKQQVVSSVVEIIRRDLSAIQEQWDRKNCLAARFKTCRPQLESYFESIGKSWVSMDRLKANVCDWLSRNMQQAFEEELTAIVGTNLKRKRWVASAEVMQALVDNDLVQYLPDDVNTALKKISDPRRHILDVVSQQIALEVNGCITEKHDEFKAVLKKSIDAAASSAAGVEKDRAMTFLAALKSQIRKYLHTGTTNSLLTTMPDASDTNYNCDEQSADVFNPENKYFVCLAMLDAIDLMAAQHVDVTESVLAYIKDRAHGASRGVMPRCGELCPICKSPCTRELGHVMNEEEKRHDSYHQPAGLVGRCDVDTSELMPGSCSFNAKNGRKFKHSDSEWHKYSDFDKVFPNWYSPVEKEPLLLREHIFYNYQEDLASFFSLKKCTKLPPSYNHQMSDIKQHIHELLSW